VSNYAAQGGLKLVILLPLPPECRDFRHIPPTIPHFAKLLLSNKVTLTGSRDQDIDILENHFQSATIALWNKQLKENLLATGRRNR
jgi:hypothetical protein